MGKKQKKHRLKSRKKGHGRKVEDARADLLSSFEKRWTRDFRKAVKKEVRRGVRKQLADAEFAVEVAEQGDYDAPSNREQVPPLVDAHSDIALRYISTLEEQLRAKDEQLTAMDARLSDAFELQRALALLVKRFEINTGISSDVIWAGVSDDELSRPVDEEGPAASADTSSTRSQQDESGSGKATAASPVPGESLRASQHSKEEDDQASRQEGQSRSFTEWLKPG